ncbi:MAG: protein-L-isoaspartate(D-aspartate) O-methyltransferase [Methylococcales bacterium]
MNHRHQGIGMTSRRTRERMVNRLIKQGINHSGVLDVMLNTPRHLFMAEALSSRAYEDTALPIGHGQTISQPYMVARMTQVLLQGVKPNKVLDVGTGSGYQAAILAQLVPKVYTVERIKPLQIRARRLMQELKLYNVSSKYSDGGWGWDEHGPFDGIVVAAAPKDIPPTLLEQLAPGGVMLIPVGNGSGQVLKKIVRSGNEYEVESIETVSFVPMISGLQ